MLARSSFWLAFLVLPVAVDAEPTVVGVELIGESIRGPGIPNDPLRFERRIGAIER